MRSSVRVGEGLNHKTIAQDHARSSEPSGRGRGTPVSADLAYGTARLPVTQLGLPTRAAICAQRPILTIVGRAFFSGGQPRLGRPRDERAEVQDTYGGDPDAREHPPATVTSKITAATPVGRVVAEPPMKP